MKIEFIDQLLTVLQKFEIDINDVCLATSAVLAINGLRVNKDIEFVLRTNARKILEKRYDGKEFNRYSGVIRLSENMSCLYSPYEMFGISDDELFTDIYSTKYKDLRVINLDIYIAKKKMQNRMKDLADIELVRKSLLYSEKLWNKSDFYLEIAKKNGYIMPSKSKMELFENIMRNDLYIFGTGRIAKNIYNRIFEAHLSESVKGFVVSKKEQDFFCNKKVMEISEVIDTDTIVLLCIELHCQLEVQNELKKYGLTNMVAGYQYWE